jgi:hypothetical protein
MKEIYKPNRYGFLILLNPMVIELKNILKIRKQSHENLIVIIL